MMSDLLNLLPERHFGSLYYGRSVRLFCNRRLIGVHIFATLTQLKCNAHVR